ncbi:MAG: hypothetical protein HYU99_12090 [Deltaproteobacteria bacterium]|nr:hypothetical protein [Deltaproteobacteria bacterium]
MKKAPLLLLLIFIFSLSRPAHAYLDPGTGSMVLQIVVGGILAALYTLKVYWRRLVKFFKKKEP